MSSNRKIFSTINYIWIGPPPVATRGELGHDIFGPSRMAQVNQTNPIAFWCLIEFKEYYQEKFKAYANLTVSSVEDFLNLNQHNQFNSQTERVKTIIDIHLSKSRGRIRDKVSVKNIFSLYLLMINGGYVLDTNIVPTTKQIISLPSYNSFRLPRLYEKFEFGNYDYWIMYSPARAEGITLLFERYLTHWSASQNIFASSGYSNEYHRKLAVLISNNIFYLPNFTYWTYQMSQTKSIAYIDELQLTKQFYNTHTFINRFLFDREKLYSKNLFSITVTFFSDYQVEQIANACDIITAYLPENVEMLYPANSLYTQIYFSVLEENINELDFQISQGVNVNHQLSHEDAKGETPLHVAIRNNLPNMVEALLERKADPLLKVSYKKAPLQNAYDLATSCGFTRILEIVNEHKVQAELVNEPRNPGLH